MTESETNLARVEDILGELRPQARRLASQAEQQASRETSATELADALILAMHARWHEAAARLAVAQAERDRVRIEVERAMTDLGEAETAASGLSIELAIRATLERDRREAHDVARTAATSAQLRDARLASDLDALERDRRRLLDERAAAESEMALGRRSIAAPVPPPDLDLGATLGEAERELADALAELAALRSARQAHGQELATLRRAALARQAEAETARRRLAEVEHRTVEEAGQAEASAERRAALDLGLTAVRRALVEAVDAEAAAAVRRGSARELASAADAERAGTQERAAAASAAAAAVRARVESLLARLVDEETRGIARAARRVGGRRLDEDLAIDPPLRAATEAALAESTRAYIVRLDAVESLASERGSLVVSERATSVGGPDDARERRFREALAAAGGGTLDGAVRRDSTGAARRLLARAAWLPDLAAALAIQAVLPPGWVAVPRDGSATVTEFAVTFGATESVLERRADVTRLTAELVRLDEGVAQLREIAAEASSAAASAQAAAEAARADESRAGGVRRATEEAERLAARRLETVVREASWHEAQAERLRAELGRGRVAVAALAVEPGEGNAEIAPSDGPEDGAGIAAWDARATALRARRDRLAEEAGAREAARRDAEHRRARAEAATMMAEERMARADREILLLRERERALAEERDALRTEIAITAEREVAARTSLAEVHTADAADRDRLAAAERDATTARERLRAADARLRAADHTDLGARLGLDALREGIVIELAGLGELGVIRLSAVGADASTTTVFAVDATIDDGTTTVNDGAVSDEVAALETAIDRAVPVWATVPPRLPAPSSIRLGQLRRRFHELGAVNPYAVDEYASLRIRLETLEAQDSDLRTAILRTRDLIVELDMMIADRFRATFRALETAFSARFEQLFGGGFAKLSLTDPTDLGSTGVEIVARPPGKKPQALAMLSGGERALTAVALLFAMLEVRPVPFCVLDEVDAALDEANIGRFADALRSLAHQTQFVVITHNRGTIEAADALYGVTVGDDSVSRVISLRLDEAQALAARDRGELATAG